MNRLRLVRTRPLFMVVVAGLLFAAAMPATAADLYLDEDFETDANQTFTELVDTFESLDDGHVGAGTRAVIPANGNWGASGRWTFDEHGITAPEELYWRYYVKFPVGFQVTPPDRGKLPGPANLYTYNCLGGRPSTEANPCWSARMLFSRDYEDDLGLYQDGPSDKTLLGFYTYHLDGPSNRGDILTWDDDVALLDHGRWYCVEGHIDLNTPGVNNGTLEGWVDGEAAFSRSDFAWRRANEGGLDVDMFWFDVYYGGDATPNRLEIHFDSLALGPERVGCDDRDVWVGTFADDDESVFEGDIEWLFTSGITQGCSDTLFCPDDPVTRGQMAAFIGRAQNLPADDGDYFTDDDSSVFEGDIDALAASGVTQGCTPTRFCPDDVVTRGQMAAFLTRAYNLPAADSDFFTDDDGTVFESDINRLAASGITAGCSGSSFCADEPITRGQMAAFLRRAEER